jgi:hypothetical protein
VILDQFGNGMRLVRLGVCLVNRVGLTPRPLLPVCPINGHPKTGPTGPFRGCRCTHEAASLAWAFFFFR